MINVVILFTGIADAGLYVPQWCLDVWMIRDSRVVVYVENAGALQIGFSCEDDRCMEVMAAICMHLMPDPYEAWVIGFKLMKQMGHNDFLGDWALGVGDEDSLGSESEDTGRSRVVPGHDGMR